MGSCLRNRFEIPIAILSISSKIIRNIYVLDLGYFYRYSILWKVRTHLHYTSQDQC